MFNQCKDMGLRPVLFLRHFARGAAAVLALQSIACTKAKPAGEGGANAARDAVTSVEAVASGAKAASVAVACAEVPAVGSQVFVVEREDNRLAIYDLQKRRLAPNKVEGLGNLRHATMTFTPDLRWGFLSTRDGQLHKIDLHSQKLVHTRKTSDNSIDIAISQDGKHVAVAEYIPGGLTIVNVETMETVKSIASTQFGAVDSRVTGVVDATPNEFLATLIEGRQVWRVDASVADFPVTQVIELGSDIGLPYDAMVTPDSRHYVVGHLGSAHVSVVDLDSRPAKVRRVLLEDVEGARKSEAPVKLPHMASWAHANGYVFVPLVGQPRLAVLRGSDLTYEKTVELRGHPVYAVRRPDEREIWVSFSGEKDDSFVEIINTDTLQVTGEIKLGRKIYHMDFTPRGSHALISANVDNHLYLVNTKTREIEDRQPLSSPSGIFGPWRAFRIGL